MAMTRPRGLTSGHAAAGRGRDRRRGPGRRGGRAAPSADATRRAAAGRTGATSCRPRWPAGRGAGPVASAAPRPTRAPARTRPGARTARRRGTWPAAGKRVATRPPGGAIRPRTSAGVSERNSPGLRPRVVSGPSATRRSLDTGWPTASSRRRTSWFLPSCSVISSQALLSASRMRTRSTASRSPSTRTPRRSRSSVSASGTLWTLAW